MACHIPPLKKANKQAEMLLPILSPIPSLKLYINEMGPRMSNGISPSFLDILYSK